MEITQQRERVVELARLWIGTPYRHMARVQGSGADCAMFPLDVYASAGVIRRLTVEGEPGVDAPDVPYYPPDWHLHRDIERYLQTVEKVVAEAGGREVEPPAIRTPLPGDFVLFHFGRDYSHGAIVIEWPLCIHAHLQRGVVMVDATNDPKLSQKLKLGKVKVFSCWS